MTQEEQIREAFKKVKAEMNSLQKQVNEMKTRIIKLEKKNK